MMRSHISQLVYAVSELPVANMKEVGSHPGTSSSRI